MLNIIKALLPSVVAAGAMAAAVIAGQNVLASWSDVAQLSVLIGAGAVVYFAVLATLDLRAILAATSTLRAAFGGLGKTSSGM